ncbi:hypothetical protein GGR52DRAFT_547066 [Hypoxylon sp. FL1284]|nr:hypothetical protein GGR52DRAFT_547066 [Hypoxylon sp. FL1284]
MAIAETILNLDAYLVALTVSPDSLNDKMARMTDTYPSNGTTQSSEEADDMGLSVAIVGGGMVGIILALGLLHRGVRVAVYERATNFHQVGAGFAFTEVARRCMTLLNPTISESMGRVGTPQNNPFDEYWDGYHIGPVKDGNATDTEVTSGKLLFKRYNRQLAFWGCLRAQFLEDLSSALPSGVVRFNKRRSLATQTRLMHRHHSPSPSTSRTARWLQPMLLSAATAYAAAYGLSSSQSRLPSPQTQRILTSGAIAP